MSWPVWLTYSRRLTHKVVTCKQLVRESSPVKGRRPNHWATLHLLCRGRSILSVCPYIYAAENSFCTRTFTQCLQLFLTIAYVSHISAHELGTHVRTI